LTKEQVILGEDDSADSNTDNLGRQRIVPETPKSQRYATRSALEKIFEGSILSDRAKRDRKIREAVEKYGILTQRAVGDYPGFHFAYVGRIPERTIE
jgi:hypothetical protein